MDIKYSEQAQAELNRLGPTYSAPHALTRALGEFRQAMESLSADITAISFGFRIDGLSGDACSPDTSQPYPF